jgi:hypothetical protein
MQHAASETVEGSPLDNLAGANVTDLRGFVLLRKRCCAGTPERRGNVMDAQAECLRFH